MTNIQRKSPHGSIKNQCKECGGVSICIHDIRMSLCKICDGSGLCIHNRQKGKCRDCGGGCICIHNKLIYYCRECGESQICIHNKIKDICRECSGSRFCLHNVFKPHCKQCNGSQICIHNILKSCCKKCDGSQICMHKKDKTKCPDCDGTKICKSKCDTNCRQIGNKKYNGYCAFCFSNIFPNEPLTTQIRSKSKEIKVINYISTKYNNFIQDKCLYVDIEGGCCATKRRIDLRKLINNTMLCIEIDVNQHKYYINKDEENRYNDLYMVFSGKYIFIRYNPDQYKDKNNNKKIHNLLPE